MNETPYISRLTTPYKDIFTTVYLVKTPEGALLFDTASYAEDVAEHILPFLSEAGIGPEELKYIFISHNHTDHAGGLQAVHEYFPNACIVSRSPALQEKFAGSRFLLPEEGTVLLGVLQVVPIPGHTLDSAAILDTRTGTLLSGDCLQLWGIFGSGKWGANIRYPAEHKAAVDYLRGMGIRAILSAHDYHPFGYAFVGEEAVCAALDACIAPLARIRDLIAQYPQQDDEGIAEEYNRGGSLPTLGSHVVTAVREALLQNTLRF